jgi:hypothetical protein
MAVSAVEINGKRYAQSSVASMTGVELSVHRLAEAYKVLIQSGYFKSDISETELSGIKSLGGLSHGDSLRADTTCSSIVYECQHLLDEIYVLKSHALLHEGRSCKSEA